VWFFKEIEDKEEEEGKEDDENDDIRTAAAGFTILASKI